MRYLMTFSYDGNNYNGYQKQKNKNTIEDNIEAAIKKISNKDITIHASGRTDAKVHAINQKAHFDLDMDIDLYNLKKALNSLTNDDIYIKDIKVVSNNFHARFDVKEKIYVYKINIGDYDPITRNYIYQYNKNLDINKMREATKYLIGEHNFKSFTKTDISKDDYVRTIYDINIKLDGNVVIITFRGSGFLRYMVRNMVGTLIEVGNGLKPSIIKDILLKEDRTVAFKTAPPEGLYLMDVKYDE